MTQRDWERDMASRHPIRWQLTRLMGWRQRRKKAKIKVQRHQDMILSFPFRTLANWVELNHEKVWGHRPSKHDYPIYDKYYDAMAEVQALYVWWWRRQKQMKLLDKEEASVVEYQLTFMREEDQLMLARLVNVRTFLE